MQETNNLEQNPPLQQTAVMCGFCRDCKFAKPDFEFEQVLVCKNENLKMQLVFSHEGGTLSVEPDFGCVQFENRT
jgi:hypothetical protein